jgi:hypothetical protein
MGRVFARPGRAGAKRTVGATPSRQGLSGLILERKGDWLLFYAPSEKLPVPFFRAQILKLDCGPRQFKPNSSQSVPVRETIFYA